MKNLYITFSISNRSKQSFFERKNAELRHILCARKYGVPYTLYILNNVTMVRLEF